MSTLEDTLENTNSFLTDAKVDINNATVNSEISHHEHCFVEPNSINFSTKLPTGCNFPSSNPATCVENNPANNDILKSTAILSVASNKTSEETTAATFSSVPSNVVVVLPSNSQTKSNRNLKQKNICDLVLEKKVWKPQVDRSNLKRVYYPQLNKRHIKLLLKFLNDPENNVKDPLIMTLLRTSRIPYNKSHSLASQLVKWSKLLTKRKIGSKEKLCLRGSQKIILPKEKYRAIIMEAHLATGRFSRSDNAEHNSYERTVLLIKSHYAVGEKEFGMNKYLIYECIANCTGCTCNDKLLPPLSEVISYSFVSSRQDTEMNKTIVFSDPDALNESRHVDLNESPLTMMWGRPSTGSIWFDQKGLAGQKDHYSKLLGVINEVGLDLGATAQGCKRSKERLMTKLYCAEKLVKDEREKLLTNSAVNNNKSTFLVDFQELQKKYLEIGRLDLFLYDVNCILRKYNLSKNEHFSTLVNETVQKLQAKQCEAETKELMVKLQKTKTPFEFTAKATSTNPTIISTGINKLKQSVPKCQSSLNVIKHFYLISNKTVPSMAPTTPVLQSPDAKVALGDHTYTDW
ncbi:uncharacterized protein LOC130644570 [Hydractinia symbiolongicarpus]|uniref:uncharacterized protein LOC130644570 n=1 Tax=Hydractinia symbiolongicarpus TaxID=13093 RepID=UPI00254CC450|nr:uncharacterized protein LOC130644570 [Hydractinia symbiolongicarpus]XP_057306214.1 uncharacterized protein LOC130644570 [Hydractinia symbiolongicarpus]